MASLRCMYLLISVGYHLFQLNEAANTTSTSIVLQLIELKQQVEEFQEEHQQNCDKNSKEIANFISSINTILNEVGQESGWACPLFTSDDAPENGGLVCYHKPGESHSFCSARCNDGYEFVSRINTFEVCDITTGMQWNFDSYLPCVEAFFPGVHFESDEYYFSGLCSQTSSQEQMKQNFLRQLQNSGLCEKGCNLAHFTIICRNDSN